MNPARDTNSEPVLPVKSRAETFAGASKETLGVTFWPYNKSFIDQACSVKMAGYWPRPSGSIKTHKKNLANIQQNPANIRPSLVSNAFLVHHKIASLSV